MGSIVERDRDGSVFDEWRLGAGVSLQARRGVLRGGRGEGVAVEDVFSTSRRRILRYLERRGILAPVVMLAVLQTGNGGRREPMTWVDARGIGSTTGEGRARDGCRRGAVRAAAAGGDGIVADGERAPGGVRGGVAG